MPDMIPGGANLSSVSYHLDSWKGSTLHLPCYHGEFCYLILFVEGVVPILMLPSPPIVKRTYRRFSLGKMIWYHLKGGERIVKICEYWSHFVCKFLPLSRPMNIEKRKWIVAVETKERNIQILKARFLAFLLLPLLYNFIIKYIRIFSVS